MRPYTETSESAAEATANSVASISHHARHPRRSILRPSMIPSERYSSVHDNSWFNLTYGSYMDYSSWGCALNLAEDPSNPTGGSGQNRPLGRRSMLMRSSVPMNRADINSNNGGGADGGSGHNRHRPLGRRSMMMRSSIPMNRVHISRGGVGGSNPSQSSSQVPLWSIPKNK